MTPSVTPTPTPTPTPATTQATTTQAPQNTPPPPNAPSNLFTNPAMTGDLVKDIVKLRLNMDATTGYTRDLAKYLQISSESLRFSFELGTDVKHALDDTRQIASKIGREYVDQELVQERIAFNQNETSALEEAAGLAVEALGKNRNDLAAEYNRIQQEINNAQTQGLTAQMATITADELALVNLVKELEIRKQIENKLNDINSQLDVGNNLVKESQLKASALGRIFQSLTGIPFLKDFMNFKKISDAFGKSMKEGFGALGGEIMRIVKSPLFLLIVGITAIIGLIKSLVKAAKEFDVQLTSISNNLGLAKEKSIGLLDNFRAISLNNENLVKGLDNAFLSIKNQSLATAELQDTLETNSLFTSRMVQNQILLTKQMGLSKEEAAGIQKFSLLTGKSTDAILESAIRQNKTAMSYRKLITEIAKVNSEISVMYKNNPDLIAKAVIEANKLGISLEQSKQISKSLLDFESSISGELEAELLTGRRFNFEKARALALDGKSVEAAKELIDQMGGLNGLTKLNVIQRERLAASIGLSAEELTKSAREAEILKNLGYENRNALEEQYELLRQRNDKEGLAALMTAARKKEGGEILLQDIARASVQQRFEESVLKLKEIFTEIAAGPLIKMMEGIANTLSNTDKLKGIFNSISIILGLMAIRSAVIATNMIIATGGLNLASAAILGGAAISGYAAYKTDDIMSEDTDVLPTTPGPGQPPTPYQSNNPTSNPYSTNRAQDIQKSNVYTSSSQDMQKDQVNISRTQDLQTRISNLEQHQVYSDRTQNLEARMSDTELKGSKVNISRSQDLQTRISNLEQHQVYSDRTQSLEAQMSDTELKRSKVYTQSVMTTSPKPAKMAEVPYSTAPYSGREDLEEYKKGLASADTPKKSVIQNNISLVVDGKQMATVLNMIPSDIA
jgi:hypothetical protein